MLPADNTQASSHFVNRLVRHLIGLGLLTAIAVPVFGQWVAEGPGPNTAGQVEGLVDGEVVGAIHTVVAHPTNANILYAGGVNGGVWKTNNATAASPTWTRLTDGEASLSIGALEMDPTDTSHQTLVAGIGSFSSYGRIGGDRTGLLRTTDGGTSWSAIDGGGNLVGFRVAGVAPRGATLVVALSGTAGGIRRSIDTGANWTQISTGDGSTTGLPQGEPHDLASDPTDSTRLFTSIANANFFGGVSGVYRSTNTGSTWVKVSDAAMDALFSASTTNVEIAVGMANNVYVAIINSGRLAGIFRSGNGGGSWTSMDLPGLAGGGIHPGGQGSIHMSIVADPSNANLVYVGGDRQGSPFPNDVGAFNFTGRLFRGDASQPSGSQWEHLTHSNSVGAPGGGTANRSAPHADSREMVFDANGELIETDDGGIYRRTSPQDNTGDWFSINGTIQTTELHNGSWDANANILIGGAQDTGTPAQLLPMNVRWFSVSTADGGDVAVDDLTTPGFSTRYSSFQTLAVFRRQVYNAANVFQSQVFPALTVLDGGAAIAPSFTTPIELNAITPTRLIIGAANSVYESLDQGDTVREIGPGIGTNSFGRDPIAYGAVGNPDILYIGSGTEVFVRTAAHPSPLSATSFPGPTPADIVIDPDNPLAAFVISTSRVYRTTNAGGSWSEITGDLASLDPGSLFRAVTYMPNDPLTGTGEDALIVGTSQGVFVAFASSGFTAWSLLGTGLPRVPVYDLDYDVSDTVLMAATLGRGAWTLRPASTRELTVALAGTGSGSVTSDPVGIACPGDCAENYAVNTAVQLTPTADPGSVFAGWSGDADCTDGMVMMDNDRACIATFNQASFKIQAGTVAATDQWQTVALETGFADPVVVAKPASLNGNDPTTVRLRNVTASSFDIRLQEWNYLNGTHGVEQVSFVAIERGSWQLAGGVEIEADRRDLSNTLPGNAFVPVSFASTFSSPPVVVSVVSSANGADAVVTRHRSVTVNGFDLIMQEEQSLGGHGVETVNWVAWKPGTGTAGATDVEGALLGGIGFEVASVSGVTHTFSQIGFSGGFNGAPCFLADMQTTNGADPANLRYRNLDAGGVEVQIDEEQSADQETDHNASETVGYLAFDCAPAVPFPEAGRLMVTDAWQTVALQESYTDPIVVAKPASLNGGDPTTVRLRNVTPTSFDIRLQEWNYLNGSHGGEVVSYLAVERGSWQLPGGSAVEAGSLLTNNSRPGTDPFVAVPFSVPFPGTPIVLSVVASDAGADAVATRHQNVGAGGFQVILQEEEALGGHGALETIHWIAWQPGVNGAGDPVIFEAAAQPGVNHNFTPLTFTPPFNAPPCFLADMQTFAGADPATLRYRNLSTAGVQVQVDEEQSADAETQHNAAELVGWLAFDCP